MLTSDQNEEIQALQRSRSTTRRVTVDALEDVLYSLIPVLDHGFIRVIDYMGDDSAVVQAARVSYGSGTRQARSDTGLIRYLMRNAHSTPFEMCEIKLHVKLPIFVARQWIRHRTANVNEYSARYSVLDKEFYLPDSSNLGAQSTANRQGREEQLSEKDSARVLEWLKEDAERAYEHYREMLNEDSDGQPLDPDRQGVARELARMNLPVNFYTQWYWKTDLHNLFHFLRLRLDQHAQYEIRVYAELISDLVRKWVPVAYEAFVDYQLESLSLSRAAQRVLSRRLSGEEITRQTSGLNADEWKSVAAFVAGEPRPTK